MCLVGVVVRRYIDFLLLLIPTPLVYICSFLQRHPYFWFIKKECFSFLFECLFVLVRVPIL